MNAKNDYRDYLAHSRSHKYLLKIGRGKDAKYFYTTDAVNAYKKAASGLSSVRNKLVRTGKNIGNNLQDVGSDLYRNTTGARSELRSFGKSLGRRTDRAIDSAQSELRPMGKSLRKTAKSATGEAKSAYAKTKKKAGSKIRSAKKKGYDLISDDPENARDARLLKKAAKNNKKMSKNEYYYTVPTDDPLGQHKKMKKAYDKANKSNKKILKTYGTRKGLSLYNKNNKSYEGDINTSNKVGKNYTRYNTNSRHHGQDFEMNGSHSTIDRTTQAKSAKQIANSRAKAYQKKSDAQAKARKKASQVNARNASNLYPNGMDINAIQRNAQIRKSTKKKVNKAKKRTKAYLKTQRNLPTNSIYR